MSSPSPQSTALLYEYSAAATPSLPPIPLAVLAPAQAGPTGRILWNQQQALGLSYPGTTPSLACWQVAVAAGESLVCHDRCTSTLIRIASGQGALVVDAWAGHAAETVAYEADDIVVLPAAPGVTWIATTATVGLQITDQPLLDYLGVEPREQRIRAVRYRQAELLAVIAEHRREQGAECRNRCGIILGQQATAATKTVSHTLWSLLNILPAHTVQKPHRHQSIAIDIAITGGEGIYTLMSSTLHADGTLADPVRAPWVPGAAFLTPPGWWHSHHNETGQEAMVFPVQDAGLHTYLRTLDIQFVPA
jgi:gentisate 1,2-dioxygenase